MLGVLASATPLAGQHPDAPAVPLAAHAAKDPLPHTRLNLFAGATVYKDNCSGCHGAQGMPTRKFSNLEHQPATLTHNALKGLTDGDLDWILQHGAPGGMPSFAEDLSAEQRWQCIEFVRRLGKDAAKYQKGSTP